MPRVMMGLRLSGELAARVDAARGTMPRSVWLERAVVAFLESGAVLPALTQDTARTAALATAMRGTPELIARLRAAQSRPLPARCSHRVRGRFCQRCMSLVDSDGYPLRAP